MAFPFIGSLFFLLESPQLFSILIEGVKSLRCTYSIIPESDTTNRTYAPVATYEQNSTFRNRNRTF